MQSQEDGYFSEREIVPVTLADGTVAAKDDGSRASSLEKLAQLDPAFKEDGKVTAGNSCLLNDGAAAVLVMSDTKATELGLRLRARIIASATAAIEPEYMGWRRSGPSARCSSAPGCRSRTWTPSSSTAFRRPGDPDHGRGAMNCWRR